ncbi:MAG: pyridoxal-phosphate dependent enzyme [Acidobacteriota bacterium]
MSTISIADSVLGAIGDTPVVRLRRVVPGAAAGVLVKLESVNPTGSYTDRMALAMIEGAEARGLLRPGMRVVEYTGGSTGAALAMVTAPSPRAAASGAGPNVFFWRHRNR